MLELLFCFTWYIRVLDILFRYCGNVYVYYMSTVKSAVILVHCYGTSNIGTIDNVIARTLLSLLIIWKIPLPVQTAFCWLQSFVLVEPQSDCFVFIACADVIFLWREKGTIILISLLAKWAGFITGNFRDLEYAIAMLPFHYLLQKEGMSHVCVCVS